LEKEINLQIAKKLCSYFSVFGITVKMTRQTDCFVCDESLGSIHEQKVADIHNRLSMLEDSDASMMISIHQNKFSQSSACGTQVFYGGGNPQSEVLAESVQAAVRNYLQPENSRLVKESTKSIYLLYYATKPAIMVECGFVSNAAELEKLKSDEYQNKICLCILRGVLEYI
jgi:N-acetylmuramoyl-L-alanine amidase